MTCVSIIAFLIFIILLTSLFLFGNFMLFSAIIPFLTFSLKEKFTNFILLKFLFHQFFYKSFQSFQTFWFLIYCCSIFMIANRLFIRTRDYSFFISLIFTGFWFYWRSPFLWWWLLRKLTSSLFPFWSMWVNIFYKICSLKTLSFNKFYRSFSNFFISFCFIKFR